MSLTAGLPFDHVAIATRSLDAGSEQFHRLGLVQEGPDETIDAVNTVIRAFRAGPALVELVCALDQRSPVAEFVERHGSGLHHIAFRVADLAAEIDRLASAGASFLTSQPFAGRAGSLVSFVLPETGDGTLIELVEHRAVETGASTLHRAAQR